MDTSALSADHMSVSIPTIAVIICAYTEERWTDLVESVTSVQAQSLPPDEIVIVIDHNPAMLARAQEFFASHTVLENANPKGLSGARNTGIAATKADWIAFLDDDAVAHVDWLQNLVQVLDDPHVLGAGGY